MKDWIVTILMGALLVGCSEHEEDMTRPEVPADTGFTVSAADSLLSRFASFENITVKVTRNEKGEGTITVTANADWLTLKTDTLPKDGIISLATTDNKGTTRREALLTFSSTTGSKATLRLYQRCLADDDVNADPAAEGYLGYGYDIYQSLDNPMAVRKTHAVLSLDQLRTQSSDITYELVHENRLSRTDFNIYSARSISEYATLLTNSASNTEVTLMGCKQNCDQLQQVSRQEDLMVSNLAYGVMQKAVWSRTIDRGALMHLRDAGMQLFTFEFKQDLQKVTGQTGGARADALARLLEKYGTHVVVQADYGGKIDYTFSMTKTGSLQYDEELRCQAEFTLGRLPKAEWSDKQSAVLSSSKQAQGAINITGGSPATRQQLQQDVKGLGAADGLPPEHLLQWLGSINYSDHPGTDEALDVVHFDIIPLWDLFTGDLQREVMQAVMSRADLSSCKVSDAMANIDLYWIDLSEAVRFDSDDNASLSRILYVKGVPVLNVCSEYVPMIRSDERVNIAYPIYNNKVGMAQGFFGLFLGDGIHQPAYVMFDETDCYVEPIVTLTGGTVLNQIAYIGGNLVIDGECKNIFSDTEITMVPGDICIHSPGTTHTVSAFSDDCILMNILMRRSTFENSFMSLLRSDSILSNFFNRAFFNTTDIPYLIFHTNKDPLIEKYIMDSYAEASSFHRYRKEMVNAQISQLIIYLLQKYEPSIEVPSINMEKRDSNLIYILRYLQANYATITLPELAAFFNYSERQIQRIIFSATGMSFSENIQKQRIERACYLLAKSNRSITEISEEVGYVSLNNFRKIFHKHVGVTPSEFRKAQNLEIR